MKITQKAYLAIGIAILELALTPILLTVSGHGASSQSSLSMTLSLLFYVFIVGSIASLAISYGRDRMHGFLQIFKDRNTLTLLVVAGLLNDAVSQALLGMGSIGTNPGIGAIIFRTWTIMAVILSPFVLRTKVTRIQMAAIVLGFAGAYLIISNGTFFAINMVQLPYIVILLGAALAATFSTLIMKRHNTDTIGTIALFNIVSALFLGVFLLFNHGPTLIFTQVNLLTIFFLGIVAYALGSMLYFYSLRVLGPMIIGNLILLVPFLTILFSWFLIGTPIKGYYFAAAALLSLGIAIQQKFTKAPEHIRSGKSVSNATIFDITGVFATTNGQEISSYIKGNSRALCVKVDIPIDYEKLMEISGRYGCLAFTTDRLHDEVKSDEMNFIRDITGLTANENAVVGIGNEDDVELAFDALHRFHNDLATKGNKYTKSE